MEFYNVMLGINSLLLLICMGLVGVIYKIPTDCIIMNILLVVIVWLHR